MRRPDLELPPILGWDEWYRKEAREIRQGQHKLFSGPTQSGKTVLCRYVTRLHSYVVVFGTKANDPSLDEYVKEGYKRIDHWPPTWSEKQSQSRGQARFILWPKIKTRADMRRYKHVFAKAMEDIFIEGRWCIVIDEGLWMASKDGLGLGQEMSDLAYGSASNLVSMHLLVQRPANVPPVTWTSVSQALLFHMGKTDDIRELASLGTNDPREVAHALRVINQIPDPAGEKGTGHRFLDLPCRATGEWSISEVDLAAERQPVAAAHG